MILFVKSMETIQLKQPDRGFTVGKKCKVIKKVSKSETGVVKLLSDRGMVESETWSAELADGDVLEEGKFGKVVARKSLFLIITQKTNYDQ